MLNHTFQLISSRLGAILSNTIKYKCNACGYSAQVWDAPDKAPIATVDTRHCLGCKSLVEVPIEFHGGGLIGDSDVVPSFLNRCPDCDSSNVQPWDAKHSCPKCGEHMTVVLEELNGNDDSEYKKGLSSYGEVSLLSKRKTRQ